MIDRKVQRQLETRELERKEFTEKLKELKGIRSDYIGFLDSLDDQSVLDTFEQAYQEHRAKFGSSRPFKEEKPSTRYWMRKLRFRYQFQESEKYIEKNELVSEEDKERKDLVKRIKGLF